MAVPFGSESFITIVDVNSLKNGMIVINEEKGNFFKIKEITTCKTGKHGAAKASISGKDIRNGMNVVMSKSTAETAKVVQPKKRSYILQEFDEYDDCLYADPSVGRGQIETETLHLNQIEKSSVDVLKSMIDSHPDDEITFTTVTYPGFVLLEDIRTIKKKF